MKKAEVKFENITKKFNETTAVDNVSCKFEAGTLTTLLGPSGCGKTTSLRIIAGLERATSGKILVDDEDVTLLPATDRDVSMVFQSYALFPHMSVLENVSYGLKMINVNKEEYVQKSLETLKLVSNLDAKLRRQVREDIREIQQKLGVTTIYVTHDQEEALAISDKVIVMNNAVIAQEGSPKDLYNFPRNKFVANFIGDANVVKAEVINKNSNSYDIKIAEMNIKIQSDNELNGDISVALRPEKISIDRNKGENCIQATVNNASFVGSSYQYILNSNVGKLYVVSGDTNDIFKVGEEVFLSINEQEVKILND